MNKILINTFINGQFQKLFFAQFISGLTDKLILFILPLWVLQVTKSSTLVAILSACLMFSLVVLSPLMGTLVDRLYKKKLIIVADLIRLILICILSLLLHFNEFNFMFVLLIFVMYTFGSSLYSPASDVALSTIVKSEDIKKAVSLRQISNQLEGILAPLLGGVLFSILAPANLYLLTSLCFLISLLIIVTTKFQNDQKAKYKKNYLQDLKEGITILYKSNELKVFIISAALINILGASIMLTIQVNIINMNVSSIWWSIVFASSPIGIIIGATISRKMNLKTDNDIYFYAFLFCALMGLFNILMGFANHPISFTFLYFLSGVAFGMSNVYFGVMYRNKIAIENQGRFFGFLGSSLLIAIPIGQLTTGILLKYFNENLLMNIFGLLTIITALISLKILTKNKKIITN